MGQKISSRSESPIRCGKSGCGWRYALFGSAVATRSGEVSLFFSGFYSSPSDWCSKCSQSARLLFRFARRLVLPVEFGRTVFEYVRAVAADSAVVALYSFSRSFFQAAFSWQPLMRRVVPACSRFVYDRLSSFCLFVCASRSFSRV